MRATDQMLARLSGEIEEQQAFQDKLIEDAQRDGRDLSKNDMELFERSRARMSELNEQLAPVKESRRISSESNQMLAELSRFMGEQQNKRPTEVHYRSAGEYVIDRWRAGLGQEEAVERLDLFHRAAAHQTTSDNPGLLPEQIMGPVVNWVDQARPLVSALGPRNLPSGSWSRPRVTQHTQVGVQSAEKTELASRKMLIEKVPVTAETYGGYVNVSRQDIDWTQPGIMDIIISDLAGQYAIQTEDATAVALEAAATAGATGLGTTPTAGEVAAGFWSAAAAVYTATAGNGQVIAVAAPDMLGLIGPLFAPVNPQNAQSAGFTAGNFGTGSVGSVSGIPIYVSSQITAGVMLILSTAAAEVYEDRGSPLSVTEPSVLGVQVAYYGYFTPLVMAAAGIIKLTSA
jgi:HK97 family phage major capsid protein